MILGKTRLWACGILTRGLCKWILIGLRVRREKEREER